METPPSNDRVTPDGIFDRDAFEQEEVGVKFHGDLAQKEARKKLKEDFAELDTKILNALQGDEKEAVNAVLKLRKDKKPDYSPCIEDAAIVGRTLVELDLSGGLLTGVRFDTSNLDGAVFRGSTLHEVIFLDASLRGADFTHAKLFGCDFMSADLTGAKITPEQLAGCLFHGAKGIDPALRDEALRILEESTNKTDTGVPRNGADILYRMRAAVGGKVDREVSEGTKLLKIVERLRKKMDSSGLLDDATKEDLDSLAIAAVARGVGLP